MPQPSRRALRGVAAAALLVLSPSLVGCGFDQQTNEIYQPGVGTNFRSSQVDVLGAVVVAGDTGPGRVIASFVNNDTTQPDAVTGIAGAADDSSLEVEFPSEIDVPPGGLVNLADLDPVVASGPSLVPGGLVSLRYTFANAEAVTFQAVVVAPEGAYAGYAPGEPTPPPIEIPESDSGDELEFEIGGGGAGGSAPLEEDTGSQGSGQGSGAGQGGEN